ncbi:hypothetical protein [Caballeronia sp. dw_19]|uniref:hypothetical protein n=1 Tax=Caballeronia sp. dw_19 TaxID=2719791 RepID=UPI001BD5D026|nr:hypothetical protein [Caballeronia sp. dw_19]
MQITQYFQTVNQVNTADTIYMNGQMVLSPGSTSSDLSKMLTSLQSEIALLESVPEVDRLKVTQSISDATAELQKPEPKKDRINTYLSNAGEMLKGAAGAASGAVAFATTLSEIGKWAITCLK